MTEEWRPIVGFEDYSVSNLGRVLSCKNPRRPRVLKPWPNTGGYLSVTLRRDGKPTPKAVHRLVTNAFLGARADDQVTRHIDGDKSNNAVSNLTYGSQSENAVDMVGHGRHVQAVKESCPQGHLYDDVNTYYWRGSRHCRICSRAAGRAYEQRRALRAAGLRAAS